MEDFNILSDYTTILALISLSAFFVVIILIKVIYRHSPHVHEQYGNEIVLFHSEDRYKKRIFRFHLIEDLEYLKNRGKITDVLELKLIMGEFSQDTQEVVKHAANHKFGLITIIAGPKVFCEDRAEIYSLLDNYKNIRYFILPKRPNKHFIIFHKSHLYIEKPHAHNKIRGSVGIAKSNPDLIENYNRAFNKFLKYARPLNKDEILNQECYKD